MEVIKSEISQYKGIGILTTSVSLQKYKLENIQFIKQELSMVQNYQENGRYKVHMVHMKCILHKVNG